MSQRPPRRRVCRFCTDGVDYIDYKDAEMLMHYITTRGKILPRRFTGACAYHQRRLTLALKRARIMALVPFVRY